MNIQSLTELNKFIADNQNSTDFWICDLKMWSPRGNLKPAFVRVIPNIELEPEKARTIRQTNYHFRPINAEGGIDEKIIKPCAYNSPKNTISYIFSNKEECHIKYVELLKIAQKKIEEEIALYYAYSEILNEYHAQTVSNLQDLLLKYLHDADLYSSYRCPCCT